MAKRILVIGAHQDDCELKAGGTAALWRQAGFTVRLLVLTNGDTGHHEIGGGPLARRRTAEAAEAAAVIGAESEVFDIHNNELEPSLENRGRLIRAIRAFAPDLVLTHRPWDYHPDHRYAGQLVHDAAHSVTVPNVQPLTPAMRRNPIILYLSDRFRKPYPFEPDVVVDIGSAMEAKIEMVARHASQVFEWLPYSGEYEEEVPADESARAAWLAARLKRRFAAEAERWRERLSQIYGSAGSGIEYAEAFEWCEYGAPLTEEARRELFPFVPA